MECYNCSYYYKNDDDDFPSCKYYWDDAYAPCEVNDYYENE